MYCPRCRIETGADTFCENCGGATVASSEVAATVVASSKIPPHIQEDIQREQLKLKTPKISLKKIIGVAVAGLIAIGVMTGYKALQVQYTPKKTVEKFYEYIVEEDFDNAYDMLVNTDDRFLTKENFISSMKAKNIKTYYIKNYTQNQFKQTFDFDSLKTNTNATENMFSVQGSGKVYTVSVVEDGKKLMFFKDYKIDAQDFTVEWEIEAPTGTKILVNGKEPDISEEINLNNLNIGSVYNPTTTIYKVDRIFDGIYDISATLDGAVDTQITNAQAGKKVTINLIPNSETVEKLHNLSKTYLDLYYSKASQDKYTSLLTTDSTALSKMNSIFGGLGYESDNVTNKLNDLIVTKSQLDDASHAIISVKGTVDYEDSSMVQWGIQTLTGTKDVTTQFYFQRVNDNWLICDTDYIY
jgi:hypothetical protein